MKSKYVLRFLALGYLALLLGIPVALVFVNAFQDGIGAAWDAVTTPEAQHAFYLTLVMVAWLCRSTRSSACWRRSRSCASASAGGHSSTRRSTCHSPFRQWWWGLRCCSCTAGATVGWASGSPTRASRSSSRRRA